MLTIIKPGWIGLFVLYMLILTCITFAVGMIVGHYSSAHMVASTVTITVGW